MSNRATVDERFELSPCSKKAIDIRYSLRKQHEKLHL